MNVQLSPPAILIIWYRDVRLFLGSPSHMIGSLAQPVLYLLVFGHGFAPSMSQDLQTSYPTFLFPGMVGVTALFAAVSSAVSLVWDRQFCFLRVILVSPVPRVAIALGKILGGVSIAMLQGGLVLAAAPILGIRFPLAALPGMLLIMILGASAMNLLGLALAARMRSMQGFQMIMSLVSMPMFLLSGAFFPLNHVPPWIRALAVVNPFTYAIDGLRAAMGHKLVLFPLWLDAGVLGIMAVVFLGLTVWAFSQQD